jgi:hypothetical protein
MLLCVGNADEVLTLQQNQHVPHNMTAATTRTMMMMSGVLRIVFEL